MEYININEKFKLEIQKILGDRLNRKIQPGINYIPVTGKVLDKDDIFYGVESILDAWLTAGRFSDEFERELAKYFGSRFSLLVNSGSSANLLAFYALTSPKLGERAILPGMKLLQSLQDFQLP